MRAVFYVRGFNEPFTEGNVANVRNIINALTLSGVRSEVLNFKYGSPNPSPNDTGSLNPHKYEQEFAFIDWADILHGKNKTPRLLASLLESCASLRFLPIERRIETIDSCVTNVVNCFRLPRAVLKRLFSSPAIIHIYMRSVDNPTLLRTAADMYDGIMASSKTVAHHLENLCRTKPEVIYPPVNTDIYRPRTNASVRLRPPKSETVILYMGGLKPTRFPEEIVLDVMRRIVKQIANAQLLVYAPNNSLNIARAEEILKKANQLGLSRHVRVKVSDLPEQVKSEIYNAADIFIFPSYDMSTAIEPPLTILEAMSCGLPVISNNVSSVPEIIEDSSGGTILPFSELSVAQISDTIVSLLRNSKLLESMSSQARLFITETMSLATSSKKLVELYQHLM